MYIISKRTKELSRQSGIQVLAVSGKEGQLLIYFAYDIIIFLAPIVSYLRSDTSATDIT